MFSFTLNRHVICITKRNTDLLKLTIIAVIKEQALHVGLTVMLPAITSEYVRVLFIKDTYVTTIVIDTTDRFDLANHIGYSVIDLLRSQTAIVNVKLFFKLVWYV